ncbi:MAG TPA: peroxidase-related enzyme [Anaerolineales bacterium]|nr:peroxidase-related enzyme [Anaerolineales bacterium]
MMWFITPVADNAAEGSLRELYDQDRKEAGYVRNTARVWSHRPEMAGPWQQTLKAVRSHLRLRTYELVTLAASRAIGCEYCMLAHGSVLHKNGFTPEQIIAILEDYHDAGLDPAEVHMMDYAAKISGDANSITREDIDLLRRDGLDDQQITDVALAAVVRNFMSRFFDALGAGPDPELQLLESELWTYIKDRKKKD